MRVLVVEDELKMARLLRRALERAHRAQPGHRLSVPRGGTEVTTLAVELNDLLDRIDAAVVRERAFLDEASHDLRTPIAIIRGELELARDLAEEGSEIASALESGLDEADRLDRLAYNLLVLARSRGGSLGGSPARVDVGTVAQRAARAVARRVAPAGIRLNVVGSAVAVGDEWALERAVINLLDNAVRFARNEVTVAIAEGDGSVTLEVRDDGPGFPPDLLPHCFDRFLRGQAPSGPTGHGTGLGLAIVAAIADAHCGEVHASNHRDGGAVVQLTLPTG
jgi:hypothetical protein